MECRENVEEENKKIRKENMKVNKKAKEDQTLASETIKTLEKRIRKGEEELEAINTCIDKSNQQHLAEIEKLQEESKKKMYKFEERDTLLKKRLDVAAENTTHIHTRITITIPNT